MDDKKNKKEKKILIFILFFFVASIGVFLYSKLSSDEISPPKIDIENTDSNTINDEEQNVSLQESTEDNISEETNDVEPEYTAEEYNGNYEEDTKNKTDLAYLVDNNAGSAKESPRPKGKRISISITGLDGRLGRLSKHADANQVIIIFPDAGQIEIVSIPRDSYVNMGYADSTNLNKLTICRSNKGRAAYLKEVARIANLPKIDYWAEFSFSQAMGIIEFLGFKNPTNTLQILRSRKGLGGDDYQRCYTQGQFIRQAMLSHFNKFTGMVGSVLVRAGLLFVETDMTADVAIDIIDKLEKAGFPKPESVNVKVRPPSKRTYKVYDFSDTTTISKLSKKIEKFNKPRFENEIEPPQPKVNVANRLNKVIIEATSDSAKRPAVVISKLSPYFQQRAWMQVSNKNERIKIRNDFQTLLVNAYRKRNNNDEADKVIAIIDAEKKLFGEN